MSVIYSQDWSAGNSLFTSQEKYAAAGYSIPGHTTDSDDPLYPDVKMAGAVRIGVGEGPVGENTLDWNGVDGSYLSSGVVIGIAPFDATRGRVRFKQYWSTAMLDALESDESVTSFFCLGITSTTMYRSFVMESQGSGNFRVGFIPNIWEGGFGPTTYITGPTFHRSVYENTWVSLDFCWRCGTVVGAWTDVAADGGGRFAINGVEQFSNFALKVYAHTGDNVMHDFSFGFYGLNGAMGPVLITDDGCAVSGGALPSDDSTPCCGETGNPATGGTNPGPILGPNPNEAYQGWTSSCPGGGTVPTAADIEDAENWRDPRLAPCFSAVLEIERDDTLETLRVGARHYADAQFIEARVTAVEPISRSLSDDQGAPVASSGGLRIADEDGHLRGAIAEDEQRFVTKTEVALRLLSSVGRKAALPWRYLLRGRAQGVSIGIERSGLQRFRSVQLSLVDALAPFYDRQVNTALYLRTNFPFIDQKLENTPIPIIGGEHSDAGATDVNGHSAEKGLVPGDYVGPWHTVNDDPLSSTPTTLAPPSGLSFTVNGTPGSRVLYYAVTQRNAVGETTLSAILQVDTAPTTLSSVNSVTIAFVSDPASQTIVYRGSYPTPGRRVKVLPPGSTSYTDTGVDPELPPGPPQVNTAQVPDVDGQFNFWGLIVVGRGEIPISGVFGSNAAVGEAPKRTNINDTAGVDLLCPGLPGWPYASNTLRIGDDDLTAILLRGPRLQHHIDQVVTVAFGVCGMLGANGQPINQAFPLLQHILTQFVPTDGGQPWRNGAWKALRAFADNTPTLQPTAFAACQDLSKTFLADNVGYLGHIYIRDLTVRDLIQRFNQTFDAFWFTNHHGQGRPFLINPYADPTAGTPYRERMEISRLEPPTLDRSNVEPRRAYQYDWDPDAGKFRSEIEITPGDAAPADPTERSRGTVQCIWSRDALTVRDGQRRHVQRMGKPRWVQPLVTKLNGLEEELGDPVSITHRDAADLAGWTDRPCYVEGYTVDPLRGEVMLRCVDMQSLLVHEAEAADAPLGDELWPDMELLGDESAMSRPLLGSEV